MEEVWRLGETAGRPVLDAVNARSGRVRAYTTIMTILGTFTGPADTCQQRTELTSRQRDLLRALKLAEPARFTRLDPAAAAAAAAAV